MAAVVIGFAYLLPVEAILTAIVHSTSTWLPGEMLSVLGQGGTSSVSFADAALLSACYLVVVAVVATAWFVRREVTA